MRRPLTIREILRSADAFRERTGRWPTAKSRGKVGAFGDTWIAIDAVLRRGSRSFSTCCTLAQLLAQHRGKRNIGALIPLTEKIILAWADAGTPGMGNGRP